MHLESNNPIVQRYFNDLMSTVQEPSEPLHGGYYDGAPDDEKITEIHRLEKSKACQMVNLNVKQRV